MAVHKLTADLARAIDGGEIGLQVAAYQGEELLVDDWAGLADTATRRPVDGETLFHGFAHAKVLTNLALHLQVERGLVGVDVPVADYWPEFAAGGKAEITVGMVLSHECGLPQMPAGVTPELQADWDWMVSGLAKERPLYRPGTASAYLIISYGWIIGEVVRRTDPARRPFGQFVEEEICRPLGIADVWLGLPAAEESRMVRLYRPELPRPPDPPPPYAKLAQPPAVAVGPEVYNRPDVQRSCLPGTGGIGTARGFARLMALIANSGRLGGVRLLSEETVGGFKTPRLNRYEVDLSLPYLPPLGRAGFWIGGTAEVGFSPAIVFMPGVGGIVWADLDRRIGGAILHNRLFGPPAPSGRHPFGPIGAAIAALAR